MVLIMSGRQRTRIAGVLCKSLFGLATFLTSSPSGMRRLLLYQRNADIPQPVRDALPEEAQTIWRRAFNAAEQQYGDEGRAAAVAWAAVERAGWRKNEAGRWAKVGKEFGIAKV